MHDIDFLPTDYVSIRTTRTSNNWLRMVLVTAVSLMVVTGLALLLFRGRPAWENWAVGAEWSVVFIVSALFAPVTWKPFLVVLLLPNALLFAAWRCSGLDRATRRNAGCVLLAGSAIALLTSSVLTIAALVLLGGSLWLRARVP